MNVSVTYERVDCPNTISGHSIKIITTYSSFDKEEIDRLEEKLRDDIGTGIIADMRR